MRIADVKIPKFFRIGIYAAVGVLCLLLAGCQESPIHELQKTHQAVEMAKQGGASTYAPDLYSLAESELMIGEEEFHTQARKIFWNRDYSMALRLLHLAQTDAHQALTLAQEEKQKASLTSEAPAS